MESGSATMEAGASEISTNTRFASSVQRGWGGDKGDVSSAVVKVTAVSTVFSLSCPLMAAGQNPTVHPSGSAPTSSLRSPSCPPSYLPQPPLPMALAPTHPTPTLCCLTI